MSASDRQRSSLANGGVAVAELLLPPCCSFNEKGALPWYKADRGRPAVVERENIGTAFSFP